MSQIQELTNKLQRDLYAKSQPGEIILNLREQWLEKFLQKYQGNMDALMLGFMFSDYKLQEAFNLRKQGEHIRMALDYATQAFERYNEIPQEVQTITLEIIKTHHGGEAIHLESKLFRNACAISQLEPKGWLHNFGTTYEDRGEESFAFTQRRLSEKIDESFLLIDLDEETIQEAQKLKEQYNWTHTRALNPANL